MTVLYTVDAEQDLTGIALYIAEDNPDRALSFVEEILEIPFNSVVS